MQKYHFYQRSIFSIFMVLLLVFTQSAWGAFPWSKKKPKKAKAPICIEEPTMIKKTVENKPVIKALPENQNKMCNSFTFDGTESHDPDNQDLSFAWDFGDGATSTEPVIEHTYAQPGRYKVQLTVTDNSNLECSSSSKTQTVIANVAPQPVIDGPEQICVNEEVSLDASGSSSKTASQFKYRWNLGDGTRQDGSKIKKVYDRAGKYQVILTVDDNAGTACSAAMVDKIIHVNEAPVANAGNDVVRQCLADEDDLVVTFDAADSNDSTEDNLTYLWDFGDGQTEEGQEVTHQYSKSGKYKATLTVTDDSNLSCNVASDTVEVNLSRAPKADAGDDVAVCLGDVVDFDGTNSYVEDAEALFSRWDFGDGSSERGLKVRHTYNKVGTYKATLTVENAYSTTCPASSDAKVVNVNSPPTVCLKTSAESACVGSEITFEAVSDDPDSDKLEYFWNFGDGDVIKGGSTITHTFEKGGHYKVTVAVDDGKGSECSSASAEIKIKVNTPPKADAGPNLVCCSDEESIFDGSKSYDEDGDELTYSWDFGDGTQAGGARVSHSYPLGGSYPVRLKVDDNTGTECAIDEAGFEAVVNGSPVPVIKVK